MTAKYSLILITNEKAKL